MKNKNYYTTDDLYFSSVFGGCVYEAGNLLVRDPVGGDKGADCVSPLLINKVTRKRFFMKKVDHPDRMRRRYIQFILSPPDRKCILWPSDFMVLSKEQCEVWRLSVGREHMPEIGALLFPYDGHPKMTDGCRKLESVTVRNWKGSEIRDMAVEILRAVERLNRTGYVYLDIHLSRFFFRKDGSVYLNFSDLIYPFGDFYSKDGEHVRAAGPGECPIEFAEPAVVRGTQNALDFNSQNYSLCALLFYLFFGRYAYDGRLLTGYADNSPQQHYIKFRDYHKMPVFIFDPEDKQNALGAFDEEQQVIDLWNECPEELKELFVMTLRKSNAEREGKVYNPTPSTWLKCLKKIGWIQENDHLTREYT